MNHLRPLFKPVRATTTPYQCVRALHNRIPQRPIPAPTPFIPDVSTFLTVIGRKLSQHASKIPDWDALFSLTSAQLRELGVEPARSRRYLLHWRERFRNGEFGVGGDAVYVQDGAATVKIAEAPVRKSKSKSASGVALATATSSPGTKKVVVNVPAEEGAAGKEKQVQGLHVRGAHTIAGPHVEYVKGGNGAVARIVLKEGLWEVRRGHTVDGGERRKAEVRAKRRAEQNKK